MSGQRAAEIAGLRWSESRRSDRAAARAREENRQHIVPITDAMRAILDARPRRPGRDLIFGRRWEGPSRFRGC